MEEEIGNSKPIFQKRINENGPLFKTLDSYPSTTVGKEAEYSYRLVSFAIFLLNQILKIKSLP